MDSKLNQRSETHLVNEKFMSEFKGRGKFLFQFNVL